MTEFAVQTLHLTKRFDDFVALNSVDMHVPTGSVYGLIGPNGAGKTTLLQHIAGIYRKDSGDVLVLGQPVFENVAIKERIAFVPSSFYIPARATLKSLASLHESITPRFDRGRFETLLGNLNLPLILPFRKFSKGMQKQAMLLLALASRPDVLLLDEPMDGLDPLARKTAWSIVLSDVAEFGTTVIVSSHNLRELEGVCDHLGIMAEGQIISEHDLLSLDGSLVKVQLALPDGVELAGVDVLHESAEGRLRTLIVRGNADQVRTALSALNPVLLEIIPLSLEELFLYELNEVSPHVKDIVL